jgi:hypothetical protein
MDDIYFLQASSMYFLSLWKTYLGPLIAAGSGFSYLEMLLFNLGAAMSSALGMLIVSDAWHRKRAHKKAGFNGNLRKALRLWKKYGKLGSAILASVLIGIPTYALVARRFKESRRKIVMELTVISFVWCSTIYWAGREGFLIAETLL